MIRKTRLCCIDLPNCPEDMVPEIPLKPYHVSHQEIDDRLQDWKKKKTLLPRWKLLSVILEKTKKKHNFLFEMDAHICCDFVIYGAFCYLLICEVKKGKTLRELKASLKLYIQLVLIYHLLVILLIHGYYTLYCLLVILLHIEYL